MTWGDLSAHVLNSLCWLQLIAANYRVNNQHAGKKDVPIPVATPG